MSDVAEKRGSFLTHRSAGGSQNHNYKNVILSGGILCIKGKVYVELFLSWSKIRNVA